MELPIAELKNAQSRLDIAMNRIEEIIAEVHKLRLDKQNLSDVQTKLQFLQDDLIKRQKLVSAIVKQIKKMKKFRGQGNKQMSKAYEKLQAYETEVSVLSKIQNDIATISNKDFAELRRMMNPTAALRDLFTGIAILFKVPKWKRWPNVQSFIAKSSTKQKILALRPHHLDAKTVKRVRKFLNEHEETVNRLAAYKANRKIAPLEPWLRTMVALAEKIVVYGLAPETLELELQKMQQDIKSENELTRTLSKCKAREKDIINTFRTIFRARGENFEGLRTMSDFLGEEVDEDDSDLDIGDEYEESKDGALPGSDFVKKDKYSRSVGLDFSVGVNSAYVPGESSESRRPKRAGKGSRGQGRSVEQSTNPALKKKKVRSTRVLSYFSGPSNSIPGKGHRGKGAKDGNSRKGLGKNKRRKDKDVQLPDLGDLLEENTKAQGKSSNRRKVIPNKDTKESRNIRSRNGAQPNESSSRKRGINLLESKENNSELTLDDNPGRPASLSISASRGSTFKPTLNNFNETKYEEDDDLSLSLDDSVSVKVPLSLCVTSNVHVSTGDFGVYKDFEGEAKAHSDDQNQGVEKNPRSNRSNKALVGDHASPKRKGAKDNRTRKGARDNTTREGAKDNTTRKGAKDNRTRKGAKDNRTRKGAKDKAISSHDGSQNLSMSSMTTSGTVIPSLDGHPADMGNVIGEHKIDPASQNPSISLTMSMGTIEQASDNLNSMGRAAGVNNSSSDIGESAYALTSISNQAISIDSAASLPASRSASELGGSGVIQSRNTSSHTRKSLVEFPVDAKAGKGPVSRSFRDSVVVLDMPTVDQKVGEKEGDKEEELDPELLETLVLKMRRSLRELDVDGIELHENEERNTDKFKDIILRYNRHRRNSISVDTDIFDIWKGMGFKFKKYKKVGNIERKEKEVGYHVEEETPYLKHVKDMRTARATSSGAIEAFDDTERERVDTV